ncbi:MAG: AAA family ATPase [Planctomycetota bacterium]
MRIPNVFNITPLSPLGAQHLCILERLTQSMHAGELQQFHGLRKNMSFRMAISAIEFSSGEILKLRDDSIVIFVGPNNAGKTTALRDIFAYMADEQPGPVVSKVEVKFEDSDDFWNWFDVNVYHRQANWRGPMQYTWMGKDAPKQDIEHAWKIRNKGRLGVLAYFLSSLNYARNRHGVVDRHNAFDIFEAPPKQPMQLLYFSESLEEFVSSATMKAFGFDLIVDRGLSNRIHVFCGKKFQPEKDEDRASLTYRERLRSLDRLDHQGDGVRSYVGSILLVHASNAFVRLLDEPEISLHPPQARLLGQTLASGTSLDDDPGDSFQLFIATHSSDFLRGVLDSSTEKVTIVRISRDGERNHIHQLSLGEAKGVVDNPILRYSTTLDAVFHDSAVVCESDADCRFYAAIADANNEGAGVNRIPDVHFAWAGGKDRIPAIVAALVKLGVPTKVVLDLDALQHDTPLEKLVELQGGSWLSLKDEIRRLRDELPERNIRPSASTMLADLNGILDHKGGSPYTPELEKQVRYKAKIPSKWSHLKRNGASEFPSGEPQKRLRRIMNSLEDLGIFLVAVGELEGFDRETGGHGPSWVTSVLEARNLKTAPELEAAREFVRKLMATRTRHLNPT